jgi:hypothetical protein
MPVVCFLGLFASRRKKQSTETQKTCFPKMTENAQKLLEAGAYVEATDDAQRTPLAVAAMEGQTYSVRTLLAASADPRVSDMYVSHLFSLHTSSAWYVSGACKHILMHDRNLYVAFPIVCGRYGLAADKLADACPVLEDGDRADLVDEIRRAQVEFAKKRKMEKHSTLTDLL